MTNSDGLSIVIVTPVLNDWANFAALTRRLDEVGAFNDAALSVVAVDDGSHQIEFPPQGDFSGAVQELTLLRLNANVGHQRAIALGLAHAFQQMSPTHVVVMDADGEDRPEDVPRLLKASFENPRSVIVARRARRSEGATFETFYWIYKNLFSTLTGKDISFGNFSVVPVEFIPNILFNAGIWNNYAATLLRSRLPIQHVATARGARYHGSSQMNFSSLVVHGVSAIAVFSDVVIGRTMIFLISCVLGTLGAIALLVILRFTLTEIFVPGYATYVGLFLINVLMGTTFTGFMFMLILLSTRDRSSTSPLTLLPELQRSLTVCDYRQRQQS